MTVGDSIILMHRDEVDVNKYYIEIIALSDMSVTAFFEYTTGVYTVQAKLINVGDTVFIFPHNKQLNLVDEVWYLNDVPSTTPYITDLINIGSAEGGAVSTGTITVMGDADPAIAAEHTFQVLFTTTLDDTFTVSIYRFTNDTTYTSNNISILITDSITDIRDKVLAGLGNILTVYSAVASGTDSIVFTDNIAGDSGNPAIITANAAEIWWQANQTQEGVSNFAGIEVRVGTDITVTTTLIPAGETIVNIRDLIITTLQADATFVSRYTATPVLTNEIALASIGMGTEFNELLGHTSSGVGLATQGMSGGDNPVFTGNLDFNTEYWYMVRAVFFDGHTTVPCYAWKTNTGDQRSVQLTIFAPYDLNHGTEETKLAFIEIFRKKKDDEFRLIERIKPATQTFDYIDTGKITIGPYEPISYVWGRPLTGAVVRDRVVVGNMDFKSRSFDLDMSEYFTVSKETLLNSDINVPVIPRNSLAEVYVRARFQDGIQSFHYEIARITSVNEEAGLVIQQTQELPLNPREVGLYVKYSNRDTVTAIKFNSIEIYNTEIPSLGTRDAEEADQIRPAAPRIFLGYRYIWRQAVKSGATITSVQDWVFDRDYDNTFTQPGFIGDRKLVNLVSPTPSTADPFPDYIDVEIVSGQTLKYKRVVKWENVDGRNNYGIYELAILDALKSAVSTGNLNLKLLATREDGSLSTQFRNNELLNTEVEVVGIEDQGVNLDPEETGFAGGDSFYSTWKGKYFVNTREYGSGLATRYMISLPPPNNKVYLILPIDSLYAKVDNESMNNREVIMDWAEGSTDNFNPTASYEFELIGVDEVKFSDDVETENVVTNKIPNGGGALAQPAVWTTYEHDYGLIATRSVVEISDLIYLQQKFNAEDAPPIVLENTGYTKKRIGTFVYYEPNIGNIFEVAINQKDFNSFETEFPNQLRNSQTISRGTGLSGARTFLIGDNSDVGNEYGEIVDIREFGQRAVIFCQRGVAVVNVGEIVTQQPTGEMSVATDKFLGSRQWILREALCIDPYSIQEYDNSLYFFDGSDIRALTSEGLMNLSKERVVFGNAQRYTGAIDPDNGEYRLSDGTQTWAYGIDSDEMFGPYTYTDELSIPVGNRIISINTKRIKEHNLTNNFDGAEFLTEVEGFGDDVGDSIIDKLFKRFHIMLRTDEELDKDSATQKLDFSYTKIHEDTTREKINDLRFVRQANDKFRVGVDYKNQNSTLMFWKFKTNVAGFTLKALSLFYLPRLRK